MERPIPRFNFEEFVRRLVPPQPFDFSQLMDAGTFENQVAGHPGFLVAGNYPNERYCMKPINPHCIRSRRELLFYQLCRYYSAYDQRKWEEILFYQDFAVFVDPHKKCDCVIRPNMFFALRRFVPIFYHLKRLTIGNDDYERNTLKQQQYLNTIYSENTVCPCYMDNRRLKSECSIKYEQKDYLCIEDLTALCKSACALDMKMGRITYDPMAPPHKREEQLTKYPRLGDFGFRILGMKTIVHTRKKDFGKTLENHEAVFRGLETFFLPLEKMEWKIIVINKFLWVMERLLEWFEVVNICQLRFISSSLLFVYDIAPCLSDMLPDDVNRALGDSVRVAMIDFAHVFHTHEPQTGPSRTGSRTSYAISGRLNKDDGYLYGLRKLMKFYIMMNRAHRIQLAQLSQTVDPNWTFE